MTISKSKKKNRLVRNTSPERNEVRLKQKFAGDSRDEMYRKCSDHGSSGGINANYTRDVTLQKTSGQKYVRLRLLILVTKN